MPYISRRSADMAATADGTAGEMAKKVRKPGRTARAVVATSAEAAGGGRWTVRGVPSALQKAAGDAARARGLTLGQWLSEVVEAAAGPGTAASPAAADAGWTEAIERRLDRLERAVFAATGADAASEPAAAH